MKNFVKLISLFMVALMLVSAFAVPVLAADGAANEAAPKTFIERLFDTLIGIITLIINALFFVITSLVQALFDVLMAIIDSIVYLFNTIVNIIKAIIALFTF